MNPNKSASLYPPVQENATLHEDEFVGQILRSLGEEKSFTASTDFDLSRRMTALWGRLRVLGRRSLQSLLEVIARIRARIPSSGQWWSKMCGWVRTPQAAPVLAVLCIVLLLTTLLVWISKAHDGHYYRSLADTVRQLEAEKEDLLAREQVFDGQRKDLESRIDELTQKAAGLSAQIEAGKAGHEKFLNEKTALESEIVRLGSESVKFQSYNEEAARRLADANSKYEELKQKFLTLSKQKKKTDRAMKKFMKELSEEEKAVSLGTAVVRG